MEIRMNTLVAVTTLAICLSTTPASALTVGRITNECPIVEGVGARVAFETAKQAAKSEEAWMRAEKRLALVTVGMTEQEFMAAVEMTILVNKKDAVAVDSFVEGYLTLTDGNGRPYATGEKLDEERRLLFGYQDADGNVTIKTVATFRGNILIKLEQVGPQTTV